MALADLITPAVAETPTGVTGLPGQAIAEDAARKILSADTVYAPFLVLTLGVIMVLAYLLWRRGTAYDVLHERVVVVAEGYKTATANLTVAVEAMKASQTATNQALHDLAREAEGEAREARHGLAQVMQVLTSNHEVMRRIDGRGEAMVANQAELIRRVGEINERLSRRGDAA